ncbi:MAG: 4Fe-4S dicluster domain-containing protein [Pseudomonadota bacterium]|jgi:ferredoxin-type protein NapG|nr:4Fe-4S dicluster domain-containing protein [Pseudomonadota bacterium]NLX32154.1 4Fe-4S dicluster domain-containing protein [Deltaproteobacteria bacterium]HNU85524.1 4Fe-4S dicluster domain-containing protein [Syntrophales bacterium]HNZ34330.1 4Fe-4S dicluster domain-containing protein [Syntrophales bacterium]HOF74206.1 4Fe-4S dicluster domain-containing protein [Syntrophales bacterium]
MAFSRRDTIQLLVSGAVASAVFGLFKVSGAKEIPRPPGALEEKYFLQYCARCYRCVDVCPTDALRPAGLTGGIASFGTPVLLHKECIFCMACIKECPTGAIAKISRDEVDIGTAVIDRSTCLTWTGQEDCTRCYDACRYDAIILEKDKFPVVLEDPCTGCNACEKRCPTKPKSIVTYYDKVKRIPPPEKGVALRRVEEEDRGHARVEGFTEWLKKRIHKLGEHYGIIKEDEEE